MVMSNILHELSRRDQPAWLWDTERRRIVWANDAGVAFWNGTSLFDLLDRRFGEAEDGVEKLASLAGELAPGEQATAALVFPSRGAGEPVDCQCRAHALNDGRQGLLVTVGAGGQTPTGAGDDSLSAQVLGALPLPVMIFDETGAALFGNSPALDLFGNGAATAQEKLADRTFDDLLQDGGSADFLARTAQAGTLSETRELNTRLGVRRHQITARLVEVAGDDGVAFVVLFDDVTDRRALERELQDKTLRLEGMLAAACDFTFELDQNFDLRALSERFEKYSATRSDDLFGKPYAALEAALGGSADGLDGLLAAKAPFKRMIKRRGPDGVLTLTAVPYTGSTGDFAGYRGTATFVELPDTGEAPDSEPDGARQEPAPDVAANVTPFPGAEKQALDDTDRRKLKNIGKKVEQGLKTAGAETSAAAPADETGQTADRDTAKTGDPAPEQAVQAKPEPEYDTGLQDKLESYLAKSLSPLLVHRNYEILFANQAAADLLGFVDGQSLIAAHSILSLFPGNRSELIDWRDPANEARKGGAEQPARLKLKAAGKKNKKKTFKALLSPIDWRGGQAVEMHLSGPPRGEQTATPDQPEPQPAPAPSDDVRVAELRAILDTAADGIITLDEDGTIETFNASAEAMFGYATGKVKGRRLQELMTPESAEAITEYLASFADSGLASLFNDGREVTALERKGGEVPLFLTLGRMQSESGGKALFCAVARDITNWKKTETDLRRAKEDAERANTQKSDFLAKISHELRTPLNAIIGFSDVMRSEKFGAIKNKRYMGYINDIHTSGEHLLSLINDLLDLSKIEAGKFELNFTSVDLAEVIQKSVKIMMQEANRARVIIRTSLAPDTPAVVADARAMRQIILNLLSNALKFTDAGGQVIVSVKLEDDGKVKLRVRDTGIGMDEPGLDLALEPFRQVEQAGRQDFTGTGLGLPLTKALAEANRAEFYIESEPKVGTLVEITFPTTRVLAD
jgi:PAS domain S-box-containing protein